MITMLRGSTGRGFPASVDIHSTVPWFSQGAMGEIAASFLLVLTALKVNLSLPPQPQETLGHSPSLHPAVLDLMGPPLFSGQSMVDVWVAGYPELQGA